MMLHTKYQGSKPYGFIQDFFTFFLIGLCTACDPQGEPFLGLGDKISANLVEVR